MDDDEGEDKRGQEPPDLIAPDELQFTPEQHQRLKTHLHGRRFERIRHTERSYLVIGSGKEEAAKRRKRVYDQLDGRQNAAAFRLEDFELGPDELMLWAPAFEILAAMASHIVGILEDFDGGYVWELGSLFNRQLTYRDSLWLLKRRYSSEATMREQYDNGMAASHLAWLEATVSDRVIPWESPDELSRAVDQIP